MPGRRAAVDPQGPVLIEGPVEIALGNGTIVRSDRFVVAVCTSRRSRTSPWCDTSHRPRERDDPPPAASTAWTTHASGTRTCCDCARRWKRASWRPCEPSCPMHPGRSRKPSACCSSSP
ncbi:CDGSH iron-sulfur domain-containing protein [Streptomyces nojiriensis]|uniref:CDGSH iron-sulfur domain-containing protein n=1 Tax=Streptomyces nojiriensis TaxID=66374 RepID=UPI0036D9C35A